MAERHAPCVYFCPEKNLTCVPYPGMDYATGKHYRIPWERPCYKADRECGWSYGLVDGEWKSMPTARKDVVPDAG